MQISSCARVVLNLQMTGFGTRKGLFFQGGVILVGTMDTIYLHIGMILSTLDLSPHGFAFGLYPKRPHTNEDICPSLYTLDPPHF